MLATPGASVAVGVVLGLLHFCVFFFSVRFVMAGRPSGATALALGAVLARHLLLGILFMAAWREGGAHPLPMALGLVGSWMGIRGILALRARQSWAGNDTER